MIQYVFRVTDPKLQGRWEGFLGPFSEEEAKKWLEADGFKEEKGLGKDGKSLWILDGSCHIQFDWEGCTIRKPELVVEELAPLSKFKIV